MVAATVLTGVSVGLAAWLPLVVSLPLAAALAGLSLAGLCNPFLNVPLTTYTQAVVPDEKRGKVFAVMRLGLTGAAPIGIALAGPLVSAFGPVPVLLGMSTIVALAGVSGLFTPLVRIGSVVPDPEPAD
jgi:MFS family permease